MADEADMAHELEQLALNCALEQRKGGGRLIPKGLCYNCEEPLPAEKIFCDKACADDWERRQKILSARRA